MQEPSKKRISTLKIFLSLFFILFCAIALFIALLPSLLSSSWVKEKFVSVINQSIPGKIKVDNLSLSWFGKQSIEGISLSYPENTPVISLQKLHTNVSLFHLIFYPLTSSSIEFQDLNATIYGDDEGNTNIRRALDRRCCQKAFLDNKDPLFITLKNTQGLLQVFPDNENFVTLKISGETEQKNQKGSFNVDAVLDGTQVHQVFNEDTALSNRLKSLKITANVVNFPVELIDQIYSLRYPQYLGFIKEILGTELNLNINQHAIKDGIAINLQANSSTLSANGDILLNKEVSLLNPTKINLKLSPIAADKILQSAKLSNPWYFESNVNTSLTISNLQIPYDAFKDKKIDLNAIAFNADLVFDPFIVLNDKEEKLAFETLQASLSGKIDSSLAQIEVTSKAKQNDQPMQLNFNLNLPKTILSGDLSAISFNNLTLNGILQGLPLAMLEGISSLSFSKILGSVSDLSFSIQNENEHPMAYVSFNSDYLKTSQLAFAIDDNLTLQKPAKIILNLNSNALNAFLQDQGTQVVGPTTAHLMIDTFSIPLSNFSNSLKLMYRIGMNAQLKVTSLRLANVPKIGGISLNDFALKVVANPKHRPEIDASFSVQPEGTSLLADLLGKQAAIKTSATFGVNLESKLVANIFNIEMDSDLARIELSGEMHEGNHIKLNPSSKIHYTLTADSLNAMGLNAEDYEFHHDSPLEMTIDSSRIPASIQDLTNLKLNGKLKIADLQLIKKMESHPLAIIDNLSADWSVDGSAKEILLNFIGITRLGEKQAAGKINGSLAINRWLENGSLNLEHAHIQANANAHRLPTELLSVFSGQKSLLPILGNAIDLSLKVNASTGKNGSLLIDLNSENLSGGLGLILGETIQLSNNRPAEFSLKLTPSGYAALRQSIRGHSNDDFSLVDSVPMTIKFKSLQLPRNAPMQSNIDAQFAFGHLVGMDTQTKSKVTLNSIQGHLISHNLSEMIDFNIHANGQADNGSLASWNTTGTIKNGFLQDGTLNKEDLSVSLDASIDSLPIPLLCQFACLDPKLKQKLEIVLGPKVNAVIKTQLKNMNGPLFVNVDGNNSRFNVDAYINQGTLTLNQDIKAHLIVTPQLGEYILKDMIPVLSGMLNADQPIHLTIAKEGFAIPLKNPSITKITMPKAVLDMGKVHFSGESQIAKVLDLLTPASSNQLVWLTPAYFSLNQGVLKLERVDMLISDRYPIAAWGDVDIGKDRVNMVIALAGNAISKAFNVPAIPNSYLLQLPLTGKLNNPSIDKTKALARISALVAQSQGGAEGLLIGAFLDIASGSLTEKPVPAPTTNPLPWNELLKDQPVEATEEGKTKDKDKLNPLNEIEKGASSILKKIFR